MASTRGAGRSTVGWRHAAAAILGGAVLALHVGGCEQDCARNDHQSCTIDRCVNGKPTHEKMANGAECLLGVKRGVCASGFCVVSCSSSADCADGDDCTKDQCVGSVCVNSLQNPPASGTCQTGVCFQGQPRAIPKPDGTPCGAAGGECDHGVCSKCTQDGDCGQKTPCQRWLCDDKKCIALPTDVGMILPNVIDDDCKWHVCDGHGNATMIAAEDLPSLDKTSCIEQTCEGWTAVFGPKIPGAECVMQGGAYGVCDGAGMCVECVEKSDCPTMWEYYCFGGYCSRCDDGVQNGDETGVDCGNGPCKACLGTPCTTGATCKSGFCQDGVCCDIGTCGVCKTCASPADPGGCTDIPVDQQDPIGCAMMGWACNGMGACKKKNGFSCTSSGECISNKCTGGICLP